MAPAPNFVWRRFDLQDYGLALEPVSARITLTGEGESITSFASSRQSQMAFAARGLGDHLIWEAFSKDMAALNKIAPLSEIMNGGAPHGAVLAEIFKNPKRLAALEQVTNSCAAVLEDYLTDGALKTHLAAHALSHTGLGGREAGSAIVLPEFFDEDSWPVRIARDSPSLKAVLEKLCEKTGVEKLDGKILSIEESDGKRRAIAVSDGQIISAQFVFFATPEAALAVGVRPALSVYGGANAAAIMRLTLKEKTAPPAGDQKALFQIAENMKELQEARDAAADGRLPDKPPLEFEFAATGDIIARTSYCPAAFRDKDEWRGWTGQDRQAMAARMKDRLAGAVDGLAGKIAKTEMRIVGGGEPDAFARVRESDFIIIQPHRHNAIAASVRRIDEALCRV
jgi:phytoene dehydrogenase-like protein